MEGIEERDGQEMGSPDLHKDSQREDKVEDSSKHEGALHTSPEPLGCGEKEVRASAMSLFKPPLTETGCRETLARKKKEDSPHPRCLPSPGEAEASVTHSVASSP